MGSECVFLFRICCVEHLLKVVAEDGQSLFHVDIIYQQ